MKVARTITFMVLLLGLAAIVRPTTPARAQQQSTTLYVGAELRVVGEVYYGDRLAVYADNEFCFEVSFSAPRFRTADGGAEFRLGADDQPPACSRDGATLSFVAGGGFVLANKLTVVPGTRIELAWFQFGAIREGLDEGPSTDGRTYLTLDPELRAGGGSLEYLDVFADQEACGRFSFRDAAVSTPGGGAEFELATSGQPEACGRDGAIITLTYPSGVRLSAVYRLTVGQRIAIQNFTIPPPHTGDEGSPAPGAPDAGAGLVARSSRSAAQQVFAIGTLLVLTSVVLYAVTRRAGVRR